MSHQQLKMMGAIIKNTNLAIIGILSSFTPEIYAVVNDIASDSQGPPGDPVVLSVILAIDGLVNCFCVYFCFHFAKEEYSKCCKYSHKCVSSICNRLAQRSMKKKLEKDILQSQRNDQLVMEKHIHIQHDSTAIEVTTPAQ
mmetsp:Transcript_44158/g.39401  ORF Transcript_44158/g.39401 Transcript_44158/m.39401 type:complete len:141 (-) Transcript_44158:93-515(-)